MLMIFFKLQRVFFYLMIISCLFILNSCGNSDKKIQADAKPAAPPPPPRVDGYIVKTAPVSEDLELPGTIMANESTEIHPEISGRLTYLNTTEGKPVSKGAMIAKIYDGDLTAQLNKLNLQARVAEQTAKRYNELLKIDGVSRQEYDMQVLNISNIKADMAIVRSNIMRTEIRAPFSGTLGLKMMSPGAYVTPQTILTSIRQNSELKIDFTLPEKYASKMTTGQLIDFTTEGNPKKYTAKVIATEMSISADSRSLHVRALVIQKDNTLLPGSFVKVQTKFDPDPAAISIPTQAIIAEARGKKVIVYRSGKVSFDEVQTGIRDSSMVQITAGLKAGDTIITTGIMSMKPGGTVVLGTVK